MSLCTRPLLASTGNVLYLVVSGIVFGLRFTWYVRSLLIARFNRVFFFSEAVQKPVLSSKPQCTGLSSKPQSTGKHMMNTSARSSTDQIDLIYL